MKTKSIFIALFITTITFCFYANGQDSIKITPDANLPKNVCPKEITYYLLPPNSLYTTMTWKVTGGHFNSVNSGITQLFNTSERVVIFWDNVASVNGSKTTGTVEVEAYISSQQKTLKGKYVQNIKSLNGVAMTKLGTNISTELPYEIKEFRVVADKLQFPKLTYDNGDPLNAEKYEWTLPAGWKSKSGKTGTFILEQPIPILDVITDANTTGTIKVRAVNDCLGVEDASKYSELKFTRKGLGIGEFPQTVPLGEVKTYTFSVVGTEGTFEWSAPAGWKINGGGNTLTGGKSVQITTSKCPTTDSVRVRLSGTTPWTKFPTTVALPSINIPAGEIKQYQVAIFSLDMPDNDIASVEWFVNGESAGSVANTSTSAFSIKAYGKFEISAKLTLKGCSSVTVPKIEVGVIKAPDPVISGPSTVCDQATYTINNLPEGAAVQWSASNNCLTLIAGQGNDQATFIRGAAGICDIHAEIIMQGETIARIKEIGISVGTPLLPVIYFTNSCNDHSYWSSSHWGNSFYFENDHPHHYIGYEAYLYRTTNFIDYVQVGYNSSAYPGQTPFGYHPPGWYLFKIRGHNSCGASLWSEQEVELVDCTLMKTNGNFVLHPNPARNFVTVELQDDRTTNASSVPTAYEIQLWSATSLLRKFTTDQDTYQLSVSDLPRGIYFVRVIRDGKTHTQKLIKN